MSRQYTRFNFNLPAASGFLGPDYDYAIVPENFTQIDRLKVGATVDRSQSTLCEPVCRRHEKRVS